VGFSLSLWSENEIKARCSNKSVSTGGTAGSKAETTCLGDIIPTAG
jgi:hypothetical protein